MTNNKNVLRVLNGFLELTPAERLELIQELNSGITTNPTIALQKKNEVRIKLQANLGPTNDNVCKCCGKS